MLPGTEYIPVYPGTVLYRIVLLPDCTNSSSLHVYSTSILYYLLSIVNYIIELLLIKIDVFKENRYSHLYVWTD